jgi:hypothetical protein
MRSVEAIFHLQAVKWSYVYPLTPNPWTRAEYAAGMHVIADAFPIS